MIMIIMLAVVGLVVVNALKGSPWGAFTIAATMPIAHVHGAVCALSPARKSSGVSVIGFMLVLAAVFGGKAMAESAELAPCSRFRA